MKRRKFFLFLVVILVAGLLLPQSFSVPVAGASRGDYNQKSFWYYPWGKSGTHKGVDIFAAEGTEVVASTPGLVLATGEIGRGGKFVLVLGAKWRLHYYAHLRKINTSFFSWASRGENIASVGSTGNAAGKAPHLHYSILSLIPYPWKADTGKQGWRKMFYLNPTPFLNEAT